MDVSHTAEDMRWVDEIAHRRQDGAVADGKKDKYGHNGENGFDDHRVGASGELAVAKVLGLTWEASVGTYEAPDLINLIQVRARREHYYDLIFRPKNKPEEVFVLVTGLPPHHTVRGWVIGEEAIQQKWLQRYGNRPAAYFVPQADLHPIEQLREFLQEEGLA